MTVGFQVDPTMTVGFQVDPAVTAVAEVFRS